MIKVIGIDPGLAGTGVGIVEGDLSRIRHYSFGAIATRPEDPIHSRLNTIYTKITDFFKAQQPDYVVIEDIYSLEKYPGSGIMLGKVAGVLLLAAYQAGVNVEEMAVREVKKVVCGNGSADKKQVERAVRHLVGHAGPIRPFHASDALGLAIAGYYRYKKAI